MSSNALTKLIPPLRCLRLWNGSSYNVPCARHSWYAPAAKKTQLDDMMSKIADLREDEETMGLIETSKAAEVYLENVRAHEKFMKGQCAEFQIGRRHLANMMGEDPNTFTQEDINRAIAYLLPSGLFEPKARPQMLPPEQVFPAKISAQFDMKGKPYHSLFYTTQASFFQVMHDITSHMKQLEKIEDKAIRSANAVEVIDRINLAATEWISHKEFEKKIQERVSEIMFEKFIMSMERLCAHPYSHDAKDFILGFRKKLSSVEIQEDIPQALVGEDGRRYMTGVGARSTAKAVVKVIEGGSGHFNINGKSILFFKNPLDREQVLMPLQVAGIMNQVDVVCQVVRGGTSGQAGAIRYAISTALLSLVDSKTVNKLRLAGLLTQDKRRHERKKPGQKGARAKFTWKKR